MNTGSKWWLPSLPPTPPDFPLRAVFYLTPLLGGFLSFLSSDCSAASVQWRRTLRKSRLSPPAGVFAVMWVGLYVCMGHASFLAYCAQRAGSTVLSSCLVVYLTQCLLNHFYIIVLFGLQRVDLALLMIVPLWVATALTVVLFAEVTWRAGMYMMPVLGWVTFNFYLNVVLVLLNPVYTEVDLRREERRTSGGSRGDGKEGKSA